MNANNTRDYRWPDHLLIGLSKCLQIATKPFSTGVDVQNPSADINESHLTKQQKQLSGALMRINHSGEVCAQALYLGQSLTAQKSGIAQAFTQAAEEEVLHLNWCEQRIDELNTHPSYLNPLWFAGALCIGTCAGLLGDKWSLGFLAETENQVFTHLGNHLKQLPEQDRKSRAIVTQMQLDEAKHASTAYDLGAAHLPFPIKFMMQGMSKVMTTVSYYV